jgi:chromosome segregation ATPase
MSHELTVTRNTIEAELFEPKGKPSDIAISEIADKYAGIEAIRCKADYDLVRGGIAECRTMRVQIEESRTGLKRQILDAGRAIDSEAKRLTSSIEAIEHPLKELKRKEDDRKAAEKLACEEEERLKREAEMRERMEAELKEREAELAKRAKEEEERLSEIREQMERERAENERKAAEQAEALRVQREKDEAEMAAKREAMRKQQEEEERKRAIEMKKLEEERKKQEAEMAKQREEEERARQDTLRKMREEQGKHEAEMRRQREEIERQRKESEAKAALLATIEAGRVAKEQAAERERLRKDALPELERAISWCDECLNSCPDGLSTAIVGEIVSDAWSRIKKCKADLLKIKQGNDDLPF